MSILSKFPIINHAGKNAIASFPRENHFKGVDLMTSELLTGETGWSVNLPELLTFGHRCFFKLFKALKPFHPSNVQISQTSSYVQPKTLKSMIDFFLNVCLKVSKSIEVGLCDKFFFVFFFPVSNIYKEKHTVIIIFIFYYFYYIIFIITGY